MSKNSSSYQCSACKSTFSKWVGQCPTCKEWTTLVEVSNAAQVSSRAVGVKSNATSSIPSIPAARASEISLDGHSHESTGIGELDRVLGGGLVPGGVILMAGEPGAGKSTLATDVVNKVALTGKTTLFVSSEEAREQIALRAQRIGATSDGMYIAAETDLARVLGHIEALSPDLVVVDSIQTLASGEIDARAGSMSQVIEVSTVLSRIAKERGIPMILIGQVTKDGNIAGPRTVEHLVDVVLHFEGDRDSSLRILRGIKNRYGPSDEIGCFEHTGKGIIEVPDPSGLLLGKREAPVSGVATAIIIEGMRPLPVEVQALVAGSALPVPRRAVSGLDLGRTTMVQAILERHGKVRLSDKDVFASTIGGMRTREPSIDLATAIALDSAASDYAIPLGVIVIGEVTLSGEVRQVPGIERRLNEAARLGFTRAIIPSGSKVSIKGMGVSKVSTIVEALSIARGLT